MYRPGKWIAGLLLLLAGCGLGSPVHFVSKAGNYQIDMPRKPKETTQQIPSQLGPLAGHTAMCENSGGVVFGVTYADLPSNVVNNRSIDPMLEGACSGMITSTNATLKSKKTISLGNRPGREIHFTVKPPNTREMGIGVARVYLEGNRIYQLLVLGGESRVNQAATEEYFASFQIGIDPAPAEKPSKSHPLPAPESEAQPQSQPSETEGNEIPVLAEGEGQTSWGKIEHADPKTIVRVEGSAATMELEGRSYRLGPESTNPDAPCIMRPVSGDFVAQVRVVGNDTPGTHPAPGEPVAFHGAGLLLRGKGGELIRLERASFYRDGVVRRYVLFEQHLTGAPMYGQNLDYDGGPVWLKLERKGNQVTGSFSSDGTTWRSFGVINSTISGGDIGICTINTETLPFLACYEGLNVRSR